MFQQEKKKDFNAFFVHEKNAVLFYKAKIKNGRLIRGNNCYPYKWLMFHFSTKKIPIA